MKKLTERAGLDMVKPQEEHFDKKRNILIKKEEVRHGVPVRVLGKSRGKSLDNFMPKVSLGDILIIVKTYGDPRIGNDGYRSSKSWKRHQ